MLTNIRKRLNELDQSNPEERLMFQILDLSLIRTRIIERSEGHISIEEKKIISTIDVLIRDWEWLYNLGLNTYRGSVKEKLTLAQRERYSKLEKRFDLFNDYMRSNMTLVDTELNSY